MKTCISVLVAFLVAGSVHANMLTDPGFEAVRDGELRQWRIPGGWQGELRPAMEEGEARSGRSAAKLSAMEERGRWMGRMMSARPVRPLPGARYRFSVWARGSGELVLGCLEYGERDGQRIFNYTGSDQTAALGPEYAQYEFFYVQEEPTAYRIVPYFEIRGEKGQAVLDDAEFVASPVPGYALDVRAEHTMAPLGGSVGFHLRAEGPEGPPSVAVRVAPPSGEASDAAVDIEEGQGEFSLKADPEAGTGIYRLDFLLEKSGIVVQKWVDAVPQDVYEAFAAAAEEASVPVPAHFVFVGDSLTAQQRGYNYVDKVRGWLRWRFGDEVEVTNAGVGGDFLRRVRARLEEDVIALQPTRVFLFLGHNDSKLSSISGYERPVTGFEHVAQAFIEIIERLHEETGAETTILSASSSVFELSSARAAQAREAGRAHNLFGQPEALERFNEGALEAAEATGSDYLDIYATTKAHPDKPSLFAPDGVHLSEAGNRFIALEILKHLARVQP